MNIKQSDYFASAGKEKENPGNFRDALNTYLYHWPLIIIGVIITLAGAYLYLQLSSPVYNVNATVVIKDDTKSPDKSALKELDDNMSSSLAESEVEVFKSRKLITQVVNHLQLYVVYSKKDGLKSVDLYKTSPVTFFLLDSAGTLSDHVIIVKVIDNKSFLIKKANGGYTKFLFGERLSNKFGTWKLEPGANISQYKNTEIKIILNDPAKVAEDFQHGFDAVLPNKLSPVIDLSVSDINKQRALDFMNDLISYYNQNTLATKSQINQNTLNFIDKRLGSLADELNGSEKDIENYRSDRGLTDISSQSKIYLENLQTNDNKLNQVNVDLNVIDGIEQYVNTSQNIQSASASLGLNYPSLNNLIERLSQLQATREKMLAIMPENNPAFEPVNRQIASAKADIKENIKTIKSSLIAAKNKLQTFNSHFESTIKDIPVQERQIVDKTRQKSIKESLYTYLSQKREEIAMSYYATVNNAHVVDDAYTNTLKSKKSMVFGGAFLLGLLLPAGLLRVRSAINNKVISKKEIETATGTPVFSEIGYCTTASRIIINDPNNIPIAEEFRALRTNLNFLKDKSDKATVLLITSSISGEGKSFVSSNIGCTLAISGKKTVILEFDLRKPEISTIFGLPVAADGISNYLAGECTREKIIQYSKFHEKLDIIGSGPLPAYPSEMLDQESVDLLLDWLKASYDFIIIDSPPINLVTDSRILSRLTDFTFYIIRQAFTFKSLLPFIRTLITEEQFPEMKFIFNAVQKIRYGYGHYYGNEYYHTMGGVKTKKTGPFTDFFGRF